MLGLVKGLLRKVWSKCKPGLNSEKEGEPLAEVARLGITNLYLGVFMFFLRVVGIFREVDESFAGEELVLLRASGEFLIFLGSVIFVFEFDGIDFEFEEF